MTLYGKMGNLQKTTRGLCAGGSAAFSHGQTSTEATCDLWLHFQELTVTNEIDWISRELHRVKYIVVQKHAVITARDKGSQSPGMYSMALWNSYSG